MQINHLMSTFLIGSIMFQTWYNRLRFIIIRTFNTLQLGVPSYIVWYLYLRAGRPYLHVWDGFLSNLGFGFWLSFSAPFFVFRGFLSLEPIGLPRFKRCLDSVATWLCPSWTSILIGALAAGIYDLVTLFGSAKESGNWLASFCKCIIFWTSKSHSLSPRILPR